MAPVDEQYTESDSARALADLLDRRGADVLRTWVRLQADGAGGRGAVDDSAAITAHSRAVLDALQDALRLSNRLYDPTAREFEALRSLIVDGSRRRARDGATPTETAHAVLALREALFEVVQDENDDDRSLRTASMSSGRLVDALALLTFETYVSGREQLIHRQNQQLLELSTPVVRLWDGIVAVPLIGTLDSARAQVAMEALLQSIVDEHAQIAILDITGVPTVDTLVAQHLMKTVTATRLMGADCIISGIGPRTAQTIVQLGIDLADISTRATLADALATAIRRIQPSSAPRDGH